MWPDLIFVLKDYHAGHCVGKIDWWNQGWKPGSQLEAMAMIQVKDGSASGSEVIAFSVNFKV